MSLKLIKKVDFPSEIFVFALFGVYSLTLAPALTNFLKHREAGNYFIAIFGFLIYILEIFAFNFKLRMIRLRAEERRIKIQQLTGEKILIPRAGVMIWTALFVRMMFRVGIIAISFTALGFPVEGVGSSMSPVGMLASSISFFGEAILLGYTCITTNFFNPTTDTFQEYQQELTQDNEWVKKEISIASKEDHFTKELFSDIILHIYSFMIYTAWWDYVNEYAITMGKRTTFRWVTITDAMLEALPMLFIMSLLAVIPLRLAYWIEDSALSLTEKEKWKTRRTFFLAAAITVSPAIVGIYHLYYPK